MNDKNHWLEKAHYSAECFHHHAAYVQAVKAADELRLECEELEKSNEQLLKELERCQRKEEADDSEIRDLKLKQKDLLAKIDGMREIASLWMGEPAKYWWETFQVQLKTRLDLERQIDSFLSIVKEKEDIADYWMEQHDNLQAKIRVLEGD